MIDTVKRMVGADRPKPTAIDKARAAVESARQELDRVTAEQAEHVQRARELFDANDTDALAEALALAERRAALRVERAERAVAEAAAKLDELEAEATAARIAELERVIADLPSDIAKLANDAEVQAALRTLLRAVADREALIARAKGAAGELHKLRPDEPEHRSTARTMALSMAPSLRSVFAHRIELGELHKLERLFIGGS